MIYILLYRLAINAYILAIRIYALFNPKARLFINGRKNLISKIGTALTNENRERIWMHCASLGEFEQGRPVIEAIKDQYPQYAIVITFFSPSGYEVRKNYQGADYMFYLPVDSPSNAANFLDLVHPKLCLFIKYELWYFYLSGIQKRKIPAMLVSAIFNENQVFFKWYGSLQRKMLGCFSHIFVQDALSKKLLGEIHIDNVNISGDTRFDRVIKAAGEINEIEIANTFCKGYKIIVAGSTWGKDELLLQKVLQLLPENWRMIIVPHEVDSAHIREIEQLFGPVVNKWSAWNPVNDKQVLLVDKIGLLMQLYKSGDFAWIGGGFGKEGVHNVLEAAVFGLPCFYGPIYHQFIEAKELVQQGGAFVIETPLELANKINEFAATDRYDKAAIAAKEYVLHKGGAGNMVMMVVKEYL